jgi:uncharacterized protein YcgI (DUF1989 family)
MIDRNYSIEGQSMENVSPDRPDLQRVPARMDLIIVFSACPQDMIPVNDMKSADAHFTIT